VGDISGAVRAQPSLHAARALADTGLRGVSFVEFFAVGPRAALNVAGLSELLDSSAGPLAKDLRLGLQPHATNTVDPEAYLAAVDFAVQWGLPLATHLAESAEEREFIARATGPQRHLDSLARVFGQGKHPVAHLQTALKEARTAYRPFLAAHVNDATDEALELLAATKTSVAYCPRASDYFGAHRHFGPHRYRDMLRAGINVCLGTDSIVNITDGTAGPGEGPARLSVLDEMRFLHRRDAADPLTLIHGVKALGMGRQHVQLMPGATPLAVIALPLPSPPPADQSPKGPDAVRAALRGHVAPVSVLTRIIPVWQQ
jgi:cytosine/adenosine deaminase-related metal-dependent hydrolase